MSRYTVFVPEPIAPAGMDLLGQHCDIIAPWQTGQPTGEIPLEADAALVRIYRVSITAPSPVDASAVRALEHFEHMIHFVCVVCIEVLVLVMLSRNLKSILLSVIIWPA